jgi:YD repeat-containing protein
MDLLTRTLNSLSDGEAGGVLHANSNQGRLPVVLTIAGLIGFAVMIHAPFHFGSSYGEQDTARLVNDALVWLKTGLRTESLAEYRYYVCPGYIWLSKQVVSLSQLTSVHPAFYLNTLNLLAVILIVIPTFLFFKRLVGHESAFLGTIVLSLIPTFWQSGLYGFPHLLSMLFMVCALLLYDRHLTSETMKAAPLLLIGLLLSIALLLKADTILTGVAMFGLVLYRKRLSRRNVLVAVGLLLLPLILSFAVSKLLLASSPAEYMSQWNKQYNASLWKVFSIRALGGVVMSMGLLSIPVFFVSLVFLLRKKRFSLALLLAVWFLTPLAFWVSRIADSSRHHLQASLPLALGVGVLLGSVKWKPSLRYMALIALLLVNYFSFPASSSTLATSGNLARSSYLIKERVSQYHRVAEQYAEIDAEKKVILGTITNPYVDNEILRRAPTVESVKRYTPLGYDAIEIHYSSNGKQYLSSSVRARPEEVPTIITLYQNAGYQVYSMEYDAYGNQKAIFNNLGQLNNVK